MPSSNRNNVKLGLLITTLGGFLFTFDLPLLRLAQGEKWTMVFARGLFMFASISLVWLFMRLRNNSKAPYLVGAAGIAVACTNTIANISYIGALVETNAANVVFILALVPVLTAVFSYLFINEKIHIYTWAATFVALCGVGLIVYDGLGTGHVFGDMLALVCACCTAAAFTIIRASGKNIATSLALGSLISATIAAAIFPLNLPGLAEPAGWGLPGWVWLALNGLVMIPLASSLIANGPRFLPSADVSMFFLLETVLTPIWIWMLFGEIPSAPVLFGGTIVIVTLIAHSIWRLLHPQQAAAA